jgi:hypothetical protein
MTALESDEASFAITYQPEVFKEYDVKDEGVILLKKVSFRNAIRSMKLKTLR